MFGALADPTRRAILSRLALGEATVTELSEPFEISLPAISRHLSVLEEAELVDRLRDGQHRRVRLNATAFQLGAAWFGDYRQFWGQGFDRLAQHLAAPAAKRGRK